MPSYIINKIIVISNHTNYQLALQVRNGCFFLTWSIISITNSSVNTYFVIVEVQSSHPLHKVTRFPKTLNIVLINSSFVHSSFL